MRELEIILDRGNEEHGGAIQLSREGVRAEEGGRGKV